MNLLATLRRWLTFQLGIVSPSLYYSQGEESALSRIHPRYREARRLHWRKTEADFREAMAAFDAKFTRLDTLEGKARRRGLSARLRGQRMRDRVIRLTHVGGGSQTKHFDAKEVGRREGRREDEREPENLGPGIDTPEKR
jgi:hypothetical protein